MSILKSQLDSATGCSTHVFPVRRGRQGERLWPAACRGVAYQTLACQPMAGVLFPPGCQRWQRTAAHLVPKFR